MPLRSLPPRSCSSNRLPKSLRVLSTTTMFGSASPCRRAARFGVSPTMPRSCVSPDPIRSPTTTRPVAMPTRVCSEAGLEPGHCRDQRQSRPHRSLGVVLMRPGIAEVHEDTVAQIFRHKAVKVAHGFGDAFLISSPPPPVDPLQDEPVRQKDSYLRAQFYHVKARRGPNKAIMAVAASILTAVYHMLKDRKMYQDLWPNHF